MPLVQLLHRQLVIELVRKGARRTISPPLEIPQVVAGCLDTALLEIELCQFELGCVPGRHRRASLSPHAAPESLVTAPVVLTLLLESQRLALLVVHPREQCLLDRAAGVNCGAAAGRRLPLGAAKRIGLWARNNTDFRRWP